MLTYICKLCRNVFVPKENNVDFNSTSGFRLSESGYFSVRNGVVQEDPKKVKCPKCGSTNTEMSLGL
jgi:Zn finger protein HypA/HybF involved in hydrogenase expression